MLHALVIVFGFSTEPPSTTACSFTHHVEQRDFDYHHLFTEYFDLRPSPSTLPLTGFFKTASLRYHNVRSFQPHVLKCLHHDSQLRATSALCTALSETCNANYVEVFTVGNLIWRHAPENRADNLPKDGEVVQWPKRLQLVVKV